MLGSFFANDVPGEIARAGVQERKISYESFISLAGSERASLAGMGCIVARLTLRALGDEPESRISSSFNNYSTQSHHALILHLSCSCS